MMELRFWVVQIDLEKYGKNGVWIKVYDRQEDALCDYNAYQEQCRKCAMWEL